MSDNQEVRYLSKEEIRKKKDIKDEDVYVSQWGGHVKIRPLNMAQRRITRRSGEIRSKAVDGTVSVEYDPEEIQVEAMIQGCVEPQFTGGDRDWLMKEKSSGAISTIAQRILDLSGMGTESEKKST